MVSLKSNQLRFSTAEPINTVAFDQLQGVDFELLLDATEGMLQTPADTDGILELDVMGLNTVTLVAATRTKFKTLGAEEEARFRDRVEALESASAVQNMMRYDAHVAVAREACAAAGNADAREDY